jgi:hypothetical protein
MKKMMKKAEMGMQAKPKVKVAVTAKKMVPATKKKSYPILADEGDNYSETMKREKELKAKGMMKMGGKMKKAEKGGSFDLNKDGKTTFKDVLIGRGVLPKTAKSGTSMKKCKYGCK